MPSSAPVGTGGNWKCRLLFLSGQETAGSTVFGSCRDSKQLEVPSAALVRTGDSWKCRLRLLLGQETAGSAVFGSLRGRDLGKMHMKVSLTLLTLMTLTPQGRSTRGVDKG